MNQNEVMTRESMEVLGRLLDITGYEAAKLKSNITQMQDALNRLAIQIDNILKKSINGRLINIYDKQSVTVLRKHREKIIQLVENDKRRLAELAIISNPLHTYYVAALNVHGASNSEIVDTYATNLDNKSKMEGNWMEGDPYSPAPY